MKSTPLVSVIIPVFNAGKFVGTAIRSILDQTYKNLEIFIIDDGSVDNSLEVIKGFNDFRIKRFYHTENKGYLKTCNELFTKVNGELIAFQDADDWSDPLRIEKIVTVLNENNSIALCGCNFIRINDNNGRVMTKSQYPIKDVHIKQYITDHKTLPFCGASVIFRKELLEQVGGYREYFDGIGYEHFDWFLLVSEKFKVANIYDALYYYRYNRGSFSRTDRLTNFKKYYAPQIAWYLKEQRVNHGKDALQDDSFVPEFQLYIEKLKNDFWNKREAVYRSVIFQMLSNKDTFIAFSTIYNGLKNREIGIRTSAFYLWKLLKTQIGKIFL